MSIRPPVPGTIVLHHAAHDFSPSESLSVLCKTIEDNNCDRGTGRIGYHYVVRGDQWTVGLPTWYTGAHRLELIYHFADVCIADDFTNPNDGHTPKMTFHLPGLVRLLLRIVCLDAKIYLASDIDKNVRPGLDLRMLKEMLEWVDDGEGHYFEATECLGEPSPYLQVKIPHEFRRIYQLKKAA